jgi:hypothetical protein
MRRLLMIRKPFLLALIALILASLACNLNLPIRNRSTGPTVTEEINVSLPAGQDEADLEVRFGGGVLHLSPGAENALISGTIQYNIEDLKPEIITQGGRVIVSQGDFDFGSIPNLTGNVENRWELAIGGTPIDLTIAAGAYQGRMEFGGLSLTDLRITDGAAENQLTFSQANQVEMDEFTYETGASNVTLTGLANANFGRMTFRSGAGSYTLDFSGELQRDANIEITSGVSSVSLIIPEGTPAQLNYEGALLNVDARDAWQASGGGYSLSGDGPTLTISVEMGAGNLELRNR